MTTSPLQTSQLEGWAGRRVVVLGDVILDRYVHGAAERMSPEAPVPIVRLAHEEARLGGAANVVANVASLGAEPVLISMVGQDTAGRQVRALLAEIGVDDAGLVTVEGRPTTRKTRVIARHQQVVRLDRESTEPVGQQIADRVREAALAALHDAEALIVSDYAKGLLDARTLGPVLDAAHDRGLSVVIDPKLRNMDAYTRATVMTPNEGEAARAAALEIETDADVEQAARVLLERLDGLDSLLVTRGERGMLLMPRSGTPTRIEAQAREVFDVTGAGDTVAAALGVGLAARLELAVAARWANAAGARAVARLGTAAVTRDELRKWIRDTAAGGVEG